MAGYCLRHDDDAIIASWERARPPECCGFPDMSFYRKAAIISSGRGKMVRLESLKDNLKLL
jgi:hypothetical protein